LEFLPRLHLKIHPGTYAQLNSDQEFKTNMKSKTGTPVLNRLQVLFQILRFLVIEKKTLNEVERGCYIVV